MHRNLLATLLELSVIIVVPWAQWNIAQKLLSLSRSKVSSWVVRFLYLTISVACFCLLAGYLLSIPRVGAILAVAPGFRDWSSGAALLWLFSSTAAWFAYRLWRQVTGLWRREEEADPDRRKFLNMTGTALAACPFALAGFGVFVERTDFRVETVDVPIPALPKDLHGLRLAQISDIHLGAFLDERDLARVIDLANSLRPHLMLVTGDLISMAGDPLDACLRQLARLRSDAGTLGCLGNHEIYANAEAYASREGARIGLDFLRGRARPLRFGNATLNIAGVDYQSIRRRGLYLRGAERLIRPGALNVLLSHNPDVLPVAAQQGWNLTISGHTHGGQVNVEILRQDLNVARFLTPYVYGLYREGASAGYVTRGIGTIGIPARIGAPPEISLLRLVSV